MRLLIIITAILLLSCSVMISVPDKQSEGDTSEDMDVDIIDDVMTEDVVDDAEEETDLCDGACSHVETCNVDGHCVPRWVTVRAGTFQMGSLATESGRDDDETQHTVALTNDFEMQVTEVTQAQFENLMGYNPSSLAGCGDCPVEMVNWYEAAAYTNSLSVAEELPACYSCTGSGVDVTCTLHTDYTTPYDCPGYRLPTEAEWEYAARAGTTTATYNGDLDSSHLGCEQPNAALDPIGWFCGNSEEPQPVGGLSPNALGLYDMLGNVSEKCHDLYGPYPDGPDEDPVGAITGEWRVTRGGGWTLDALYIRAASRTHNEFDVRWSGVGFRPVKSL